MRKMMAAVAVLAMTGCGGTDSPPAQTISAECVTLLEACSCFPTAAADTMVCYDTSLPPRVRSLFYCPTGTTYGAACPPTIYSGQ